MGRHIQRDWLVEGMDMLANAGSMSITIERLCSRLAVTKGSFYHHFTDMDAYKTALLQFIEEEATLAVITEVEVQAMPHLKLERLLQFTLQSVTTVEVGLRVWALQDAEVRLVQERIDARRVAYLETLCLDLVAEPNQAVLLARMLYTVYVGSHHQLPPLVGESLQALYRVCMHAFGLS